MDEIVRQAMAKWPNVPHCFGWLALDARGSWRMRDERAQALNLPGDKITQPALRSFINRNYLADAAGRWYFQNGPQRVYVNLEAAPYVVRTDAGDGFVLHTDTLVSELGAAWITPAGRVVLDCDGCIALLEDRDLGTCLARMQLDGRRPDDEQLLAWLDNGQGALALSYAGRTVEVAKLADDDLAQHFGFVAAPQAD